MRRREFIALSGSAALILSLHARAEQADKPRIIAILGDDASVWAPWTASLVGRLRELGWIEDRNVVFEYRWSGGQAELVTEFAAEFVRQNVDAIVTYGGAVKALKQATASIPIVFAIAVDPVGIGLVSSLPHPGGNATGLSIQSIDIAGKRLELFREVAPSFRRLAIIFDAGYPAAVLGSQQVEAAARSLHLEVTLHEIRRAEDVAPAFEALKGQTDAVYVVENALTSASSTQIAALALSARLPMMFNVGTVVRLGALLSYGPNFPALFGRAAEIVDKVLRGTNPADLPVEQPRKFDLVINLKTAIALGLNISDKMLALADEVIE